jgi:hypothetical protein
VDDDVAGIISQALRGGGGEADKWGVFMTTDSPAVRLVVGRCRVT